MGEQKAWLGQERLWGHESMAGASPATTIHDTERLPHGIVVAGLAPAM